MSDQHYTKGFNAARRVNPLKSIISVNEMALEICLIELTRPYRSQRGWREAVAATFFLLSHCSITLSSVPKNLKIPNH